MNKNNFSAINAAICCFLVLFGFVTVPAQNTPGSVNPSAQLDAAAQKAKKQIEKIGQGKNIMIKTKNGRMVYGAVTNIEADLVLINDVDQNNLVTIKYQDIAKVKRGYRDDRDLNGNRIPIKKRSIGLLIAAAAIIIPVVIVVVSLGNEK